MTRFGDGMGLGLLAGAVVLVAVLFVSALTYRFGFNNGHDETVLEVERQGGGRYVTLTLDGREYKGWVR